jgi:peptidoglycan biosynthesis protein MviN/MurJ (putative lipid II flippase)
VAIVSISIAAQAMSQLLTRAFYALKDTYTPLKVALFDLVFYILLSAGLVFGLQSGAIGVAVATTITGIFRTSSSDLVFR